jgi:hypothetical protein
MEALEARLAKVEGWIADATLRGSAEAFVLEVLLSNRLATRSAREATDFVEDICSPFRQAYAVAPQISDEAVREAYGGIMEYVEGLTRRALLRSVEIRELARKAGSHPL